MLSTKKHGTKKNFMLKSLYKTISPINGWSKNVENEWSFEGFLSCKGNVDSCMWAKTIDWLGLTGKLGRGCV